MTLFFIMILTVVMITVMITDFTRYIIPNTLVLAMLLLYPVMLLCVAEPLHWGSALALSLGVLFATCVIGALPSWWMMAGAIGLYWVLAMLAIAYTSWVPPAWNKDPLTHPVFLAGYVLMTGAFVSRMGGGDIKLIVVCILFTGVKSFLPFLIWTAFCGGPLALGLLAIREFAPYVFLKLGRPAESIPRVFTVGEPVPYGIAIAMAFILLLWQGEIPGLTL